MLRRMRLIVCSPAFVIFLSHQVSSFVDGSGEGAAAFGLMVISGRPIGVWCELVNRGYRVSCYHVENTVFPNHNGVCLYICYLERFVHSPHHLIVLLAGERLGSDGRESALVRAIDVYLITY